jgi:hypothetical protein
MLPRFFDAASQRAIYVEHYVYIFYIRYITQNDGFARKERGRYTG